VYDDDAVSGAPEDLAVAGDGASGTVLPKCWDESCGWLPLHAKCLAAVQEALRSQGSRSPGDIGTFVAQMPKGLWARFQEQFFQWAMVLPGIDLTICSEQALDEWLARRVQDRASDVRDIVQAIAGGGGVWHPPGSARASRCLCDKCDKSTRFSGCFTKDGLDVCGKCAARFVPKTKAGEC
jgi:hypothetical protein